jgi:hypothetical protein
MGLFRLVNQEFVWLGVREFLALVEPPSHWRAAHGPVAPTMFAAL